MISPISTRTAFARALLPSLPLASALALTLALAAGCAAQDAETSDDLDLSEEPSVYASCDSQEGASVSHGLTDHFQEWLAQSEYADHDFFRGDLDGGSFGGLASGSDCVQRDPVIFVHGNSDQAIGGGIGGWQESVSYFVSRGYRGAELYGTTYGPASPLASSQYYHSREHLTHIRAFIAAVLDYTGADRVDIVSHSMGVTMARKAVKGGWASDLAAGGDYDLGPPLTDRVDTFVGIAGGNQGLATCYYTPGLPTCAPTNGFYPGYLWFGLVVQQSAFLQDVNSETAYEGAHRYSIWSTVDQVVGGACLVWGRNTCRIPGDTDEKVYTSAPYGHFGLRDDTAAVQHDMVANHTVD